MLLTTSFWVARMPFFQRLSIIKSTVTDPSSIGSRSNARMQPSSLNVSTHELLASRQSLMMEWASCFVVKGYVAESFIFRTSLCSLLRCLGRIQLPWFQDIEKVTYPMAFGMPSSCSNRFAILKTEDAFIKNYFYLIMILVKILKLVFIFTSLMNI